jgi:hypothetical protein
MVLELAGLIVEADLDAALQRLLQRHEPFLPSRLQRPALPILHDQILDSVVMADVMQRANVWMVQRENAATLRQNSTGFIFLFESGRQQFERGRARPPPRLTRMVP